MAAPNTSGSGKRMSFVSHCLAAGVVAGTGPFGAASLVPDLPITMILGFDSTPLYDDICAVLLGTVLQDPGFQRFKSVPRLVPGGKGEIRWYPVPLDLRQHVSWATIDGGAAAVEDVINELLVEPLAGTRPLWRARLLVPRPSGRAQLVIQVSHALGDGIALLGAALCVLRNPKGGPAAPPKLAPRSPGPAPPLRGMAALLLPLSGPLAPLVRLALSPVWAMYALAASFVKCLLLGAAAADSETPFRAGGAPYRFSGRRRMATAPLIPVSHAKLAARGGTVNDALVAALSGALRRYLESRGALPPSPRVRALLPMAFPRAPDHGLTNRWCFMSLDMPVGVIGRTARLQESRSRCDALKASPEAAITLGLQRLLAAVASPAVQQQAALEIMTKHTLVMTNVPGPAEPVCFGGRQVSDIRVAIANVNLQCSIISYAGQLRFTVVADPEAVDPDALCALFVEELETLVAEAGEADKKDR